jgi:hypothetical protein
LPAVAFTALNLPTRSEAISAGSSGRCRDKGNWFVRTLQDRRKLLSVRNNFAKLKSLRRPTPLPATRHPIERKVVTLPAEASGVTEDAAGNLRLQLYLSGAKNRADSREGCCETWPSTGAVLLGVRCRARASSRGCCGSSKCREERFRRLHPNSYAGRAARKVEHRRELREAAVPE